MRDWRGLRTRLFNLDLIKDRCVARWLNDCGYIPRVRRFDPRHPDNADDDRWTPKHITQGVRNWLEQRRAAIEWVMSLSQDEYPEVITRAWEYMQNRAGPILDSDEDFRRALEAPRWLKPRVLLTFVLGAGVAPHLAAWFHFGRQGRPSVTVDAQTPMEALGTSVHIDKTFSVRRWISCGGCRKGFEQKRSSDRFCSPRCKNQGTTRARRHKIKFLKQADKAWRALSKKRGKDRWKWASDWVRRRSKSRIEINPEWAKQELTKIYKSKRGGN